jgi:hypothetical protein
MLHLFWAIISVWLPVLDALILYIQASHYSCPITDLLSNFIFLAIEILLLWPPSHFVIFFHCIDCHWLLLLCYLLIVWFWLLYFIVNYLFFGMACFIWNWVSRSMCIYLEVQPVEKACARVNRGTLVNRILVAQVKTVNIVKVRGTTNMHEFLEL